MNFKLYECDVGVKYNGVSYLFDHVVSWVVEDPQNTKLTRGANAGNKLGLAFTEGLKEPKRITCMIMGLTKDLVAVLNTIYENQDRCDVFAIARKDGSSQKGANSVLCQKPRQLTLDDSAESLHVQLVFETFDLEEDHKS